MIQGGDIDGKGGRCVPDLSNDMSGLYFKDECLTISHSIPGILSMACPRVDGNGSEFYNNYLSAALGLAAPGIRTRD